MTPTLDELPYKGDTRIGHDVWIGYEALIMPGISVGNGAIISSRSVVTTDVPPYAVVGGNPARVIKMRFLPETIEDLEYIAWWDWPIELITLHLNIIVSLNIEALKKYHWIWIIAIELQVRNQSVLENPYGNRYYNESKKEAG